MLYNYGSRINTQPFRDWSANLPHFQRYAYTENPDLLWEEYIRRSGMSNSQERSTRAAMNAIYNQYQNSVIQGAPNQQPTGTHFSDWLRNYDVNKAQKRLSPFARYEDTTKFYRPARYVSF